MTLKYTEYDGVTEHTMETEAGTVGGTKRNVHGLAPAIVTQFTTMITHLASLAGVISGGRLLVTTPAALETKLDSIITALGSHLATLAGAVSSSRVLVTLTGTVDAYLAHLATLAVASGAGATARMGQNNNIDTGADRQFSSQTLTYGMWIKNTSLSNQTIYYNIASSVSSSNSSELLPGEWSEFIPCTNANQVNMLPSANDAKAIYHGW